MEWFNNFAENLKIFWNQPVPIIGFTVGMIIMGVLFIIAKTSIGKKALNKIKSVNDEIVEKNHQLQKELKENKERCDKFVLDTNEYIKNMRFQYENIIKDKDAQLNNAINNYETKLQPINDLLKVVCENSVNVHIKEALKKYEETKDN